MVATSTRTNALDSFGTKSPSKNNPLAALRAAKMDFGLAKKRLSEFAGCPANDDLHVVTRTDTGQAIGAVGNHYLPFSNEEFFVPTAQALIDGGAEIQRCQMLDSGTRSFMRFAWPSDANITVGDPKVGDIVGRRATLSTSHDGKWAGKFSLQMLRLVCSNGMTIPVGNCELTLTHTSGGKQQLVDLANMMPMVQTYVEQFQLAAELLSQTPILASSDRCMEIIAAMTDAKGSAKTTTNGPNQAQQRVSRIHQLFAGDQPGADNRAIRDTGWGLYQAYVDFLTHERGATAKKDDGTRRFKSLLSGGAANKDSITGFSVLTNELGVTEQLDAALVAMN